jgi:PBP1b-binding outer membrane lipoprotein LpoB
VEELPRDLITSSMMSNHLAMIHPPLPQRMRMPPVIPAKLENMGTNQITRKILTKSLNQARVIQLLKESMQEGGVAGGVVEEDHGLINGTVPQGRGCPQ